MAKAKRSAATSPTQSSLKIGYARVSTDSQDLRTQVEALQRLGCQRIFSDCKVVDLVGHRLHATIVAL